VKVVVGKEHIVRLLMDGWMDGWVGGCGELWIYM